jgi:hypothetical protein
VTLESSFPYLSFIAAIGAGAAIGRTSEGVENALRAAALGALALFSYFRGIAPAELPAALMLGAWAEAFSHRGTGRWRSLGTFLTAMAWLVFGYLFLRIGEGRSAFLSDAIKAALLVGLLVGVGFGLARLWPATAGSRPGVAADAGALTLMVGAALTLYWSFWPATAGAAGVLLSEALLAAAMFGKIGEEGVLRRSAWALNYFGQAAMAYAFLR